MKTGIFIPVFFLPFLPFCSGGSAALRAAERASFYHSVEVE